MACSKKILLRGWISWKKTCSISSSSSWRPFVSRRMISTTSTTMPWLMLPPDNENMAYKFYNLADNKVLDYGSITRSGNILMEDDDAQFVSSSHGWLTLYNPRYRDLFIFNPLTGRHIKFPPIDTLEELGDEELASGCHCVHHLITSCSDPYNEDCRVMMSYGVFSKLAFCCPANTRSRSHAAEWTSLEVKHYDKYYPGYHDKRSSWWAVRPNYYKGFAYSSRDKLFYRIRDLSVGIEAWNLQDARSPKVTMLDFSEDVDSYLSCSEEQSVLPLPYSIYIFLVVAPGGDIFIVVQLVMRHMAPDGSCVHVSFDDYLVDYEHASDPKELPYKTVAFDVLKYDPEKGALRYMDKGSLDGLAFFVGKNHSFAISAASSNGGDMNLKPNSIYFTDPSYHLYPSEWSRSRPFGGHDLGIYNYEDETFSPCYYPCDMQSIKRICPPPMWFTPTPQPQL